MKPSLPLLLLSLLLAACARPQEQEKAPMAVSSTEQPKTEEQLASIPEVSPNIPMADSILAGRFPTPAGFTRLAAPEGTFALYLRHLPLKPDGEQVTFFNGKKKPNRGGYAAVVDLPIGKRDLHQCADAVMRLRAEYLWEKGDFDQIHFNFTNGFRVDYAEWMKGKRIAVEGNKTYWVNRASPSNSYQSFWKYMEIIFSYAGTASLEKELQKVPISEMAIGDVFIQGGFPGHAVIVADMAENAQTGEKTFLLAQSYMPAQELQILQNPNDSSLSPWYSIGFGGVLQTPEWTFRATDLKRFGEGEN